MSKKLTKQVHEVWLEMDATITSCELVVGTGLLTDVQVPSRYRISFCYGVAGQAFYGSYNARSPQELGSTISLSYNTSSPEQNTLSDLLARPWIRWVAMAVGATLALAAIRHWPDW